MMFKLKHNIARSVRSAISGNYGKTLLVAEITEVPFSLSTRLINSITMLKNLVQERPGSIFITLLDLCPGRADITTIYRHFCKNESCNSRCL